MAANPAIALFLSCEDIRYFNPFIWQQGGPPAHMLFDNPGEILLDVFFVLLPHQTFPASTLL